ncbi:MAG: HlyD family efflux transporter periplasmic adaptor subunit [Gammaproteobacteria bacterium]|nr:HlyD family efflux transporter periplasmic adaptor subunit [Gammaproteobacteria bacterium]MDH3766980.1 HlyD family efflux transporter periplasmic adaptor subunit [Gammaproteobacteria bacterium]
MAEIAFTGRSAARRIKTESGPVDRLTMPIFHQGKFLGALIVEADGLDYPNHKRLLAKINGSEPQKTSPEEAAGHRMSIVLDLLATCLDTERAQSTAMAFVTELATRTGCDRVSYGRVNRTGQVRVVAISNSARVAERSNLVRAIEAAMNETIDQGTLVLFPRQGDMLMSDREHVALSRMQGDSQVLSVPLAHENRITGALTLERHGSTPFGAGITALCETLAVVAGPILELKHRDDQRIFGKIADSVQGFLKALIGPRHTGLKLAAVSFAILMTWLVLATGTHRVTAPAQLEGSIHRAVVAPLDGFIASAEVRAGDTVSAGDLLSQLDDSDLKLELSKWQSESEQLRKQYRGALASHDRAETTILSARIARAEAQLELLSAQLARTELRAPFDGIVVAGDLSQLLGSPIQRGDILFEVAPLDDYRVVLEVDERDVSRLSPGQTGRLALEGLPAERLAIVVDNITPVATARDGRNFFRVEARVESNIDLLRPGMAGIAKVDAGQRRLIWIWTHRLADWLRLRLWKSLP